jgi:hypothetical protein
VVFGDGKSCNGKIAGSRCSYIENIWSVFGGKMSITISNIRQNPKGEYIGRENKTFGVNESPLANPFALKRESERDGVIEEYRVWLEDNLYHRLRSFSAASIRNEIERLKKIYVDTGELNLVCWCFPRRCHGEVIREIILRELDERTERR